MFIATIAVNLVPYILAAIFAVGGIRKLKKEKMGYNISWYCGAAIVWFCFMVGFTIFYIATFNGDSVGPLSLVVLFAVYLLCDAAIYCALQPRPYLDSFLDSFICIILALLVFSGFVVILRLRG